KSLEEHSIGLIDIIIVNLYPFSTTAKKKDVSFDEVIEMIDIGGPSMIRAGSKNFKDVVVIVDPSDYPWLIEHLGKDDIAEGDRLRLAAKAFNHTASYDSVIANWLTRRTEKGMPEQIHVTLDRLQSMRYGENPHQQAALYLTSGLDQHEDLRFGQLGGKELSYNNIVDMGSAYELVREFRQPACIIVKHTNPCGAAVAESIPGAYERAFKTDPVSSYGGICGFNAEVDEATARLIGDTFYEVIVAPSFSRPALEILSKKKNLRLIRVDHGDSDAPADGQFEMHDTAFGVLVQTRDTISDELRGGRVVTKRAPTEGEMRDMDFALKVCKHTKSNTIIVARSLQLVGVGAGQMSRVDSAKIAIMKSGLGTEGAVGASDAFFPFADGLKVLMDAGITAVVQPGGSIRDQEVIHAADEAGIAMVFTGVRHFKH
ncbi:MAG: bifunctional phosphoribosylaminoimidazolecarboxamide formyltransferase/IMP cyclohydrolase, partial [Deltaproteobacteria bacterium]|nr:bifunctional phosphoribosylaminoimidazolecarboxamide formyltransferase/IMP cyclohydrolase [Deltaproteobacteria bacterium]